MGDLVPSGGDVAEDARVFLDGDARGHRRSARSEPVEHREEPFEPAPDELVLGARRQPSVQGPPGRHASPARPSTSIDTVTLIGARARTSHSSGERRARPPRRSPRSPSRAARTSRPARGDDGELLGPAGRTTGAGRSGGRADRAPGGRRAARSGRGHLAGGLDPHVVRREGQGGTPRPARRDARGRRAGRDR